MKSVTFYKHKISLGAGISWMVIVPSVVVKENPEIEKARNIKVTLEWEE